jgi:apolipoprotein N-acyltransferase
MHLVPFTEHFPYRKAFPWVYDLLVANDTHFWEKGTVVKVFNAAGLSFSSPICFEDTFGYISRRFVNAGARAIVNLTNDAWAASGPSQWQHMSMAVFRAVENRVPLVRSTASGQTCMVDPNGRVVAMAPAFEEAYLVCRVPVLAELPKTFYRIWGDLWGILFAAVSAITLVTGMLTRLRNI